MNKYKQGFILFLTSFRYAPFRKKKNENREQRSETNQISNLNSIGLIYKNQQKIEKSLNLFEEALKISEELNDSNNISIVYGNIGNIHSFI
ncbi:MAG: tetratricopeptide repeat protein [Vicingaceae bacterium]|nr:tetratricopeptide repeat protein [Vicingaceae bacterium]